MNLLIQSAICSTLRVQNNTSICLMESWVWKVIHCYLKFQAMSLWVSFIQSTNHLLLKLHLIWSNVSVPCPTRQDSTRRSVLISWPTPWVGSVTGISLASLGSSHGGLPVGWEFWVRFAGGNTMAEEYVVYLNQADELLHMTLKSDPFQITIKPSSFEIFTFVPVQNVGSTNNKLAPIRLKNMFNSGGTIQELETWSTILQHVL